VVEGTWKLNRKYPSGATVNLHLDERIDSASTMLTCWGETSSCFPVHAKHVNMRRYPSVNVFWWESLIVDFLPEIASLLPQSNSSPTWTSWHGFLNIYVQWLKNPDDGTKPIACSLPESWLSLHTNPLFGHILIFL